MSNPLLDSLAAGFDGDGASRALLDAAMRGGLPGARSESWKYTSLRALERRAFATNAAAAHVDAEAIAGIPAPRLVFVNGRHDPALSDLSGLPDGVDLHPEPPARAEAPASAQGPEHVFARLNDALAADGMTLSVAADRGSGMPVHLVFVGATADTDAAWQLRHGIRVGANARLAVVEHHLAVGAQSHFADTTMAVELQAGAELVHARVQRDGPANTQLSRTHAVLGAGARYRRLDLELGAGLSRHELDVRLAGEGARVQANGVLLADARHHLDTRLAIEHAAANTACDLVWRGLGAGRGRVVFHGGIVIRAGADGSDATLSNKNLLLDEGAEIDTQPVLEIHADEVKAAHGATVGQLDANALFYLRTRGLPLAQAQRLLTTAFAREPLLAIEDVALRERLTHAVDEVLSGFGPA